MIWRMAAMALTLGLGGSFALRADPALDSETETPATTLTWQDCVRLATG